jgi:hypothetical protein
LQKQQNKELRAMTEVFDKRWNTQYEKLVEFKRHNGHCMVPIKYEQYKSLAQWVAKQRNQHVNNKIRQDRKERLDEIGLPWKVDGTDNDKLWHQHYEKLVDFKRKNGHCVVPFKYQEDKFLGQWVSHQRTFHKYNKLRLDRKGILDEIGFVWKAYTDNENDKLWHQQYEKLVEFKRKKGHCLVPRKYELDKSLGMWVSKQRSLHCHNTIRLDREGLLDEIEFVWKAGTGPARDSTSSSVGLPNEALVQESEQARDGNRLECPSRNRKRPRTGLAESGRMIVRTNQRGKATSTCSSLEADVGVREEEDSRPRLVTASALVGLYPDREVVQDEAIPPGKIPSGWTRIKLEPDC